jgi:hypothetical protein
MGFRVNAPASDTGYNRTSDWPAAGGAGKGMGMGLKSTLSSTIGTNSASQWHPTVAWMLGFVVVEMIAFHFLSRFLNL